MRIGIPLCLRAVELCQISLVGLYPDIAFFVGMQSLDKIVFQSVAGGISPEGGRRPVVAVQSVAGTHPEGSFCILAQGSHCIVGKAAGIGFCMKVIAECSAVVSGKAEIGCQPYESVAVLKDVQYFVGCQSLLCTEMNETGNGVCGDGGTGRHGLTGSQGENQQQKYPVIYRMGSDF